MKMPSLNRKGGKGRNNDSNSEDDAFDLPNLEYAASKPKTDVPAHERYEEKFVMALEQANEKSAQTRVEALQSICELLMHRFMPNFVEQRKMALMELVEKSVRRGKGQEQEWGARLASLLMLQLHAEERMTKAMNQLLLSAVLDKSVAVDARIQCCSALGLLNFLRSKDTGVLVQLMQCFESIFAGSYLRADDKTGALHAAALSAWGLLLTLIPSGDFVALMTTGKRMFAFIEKFLKLLQSPQLDIRIAAGETIALILESGRSHNEDFLESEIPKLYAALKELATDSHKRATFRDVLRYLEKNISPQINIRFGSECLILDDWAIRHKYSALCSVVGPGMTTQLQDNEFLRHIFQLGAKLT